MYTFLDDKIAWPEAPEKCLGTRLSKQERNRILNFHNQKRSELARGLIPNKSGRKMPKSKNMRSLVGILFLYFFRIRC